MPINSEAAGQRRDYVAIAVLVGIGLLFFGLHAPHAGLHLDDHGFYQSFSHYDWAQLWEGTTHYVPGRNLYIPLFFALHKLCGGSVAAMHLVGLSLDILNSILVMALVLRIGASRGAALAAAGMFLVWPNHGETHWWTSAILMNLFTMTLTLGAFLVVGQTTLPRAPRLGLAALLYIIALFDYDQVFLLWIPLLAFAHWTDPGLKPRRLAVATATFILLDTAHLMARLFAPHSSGGRPVPRTDVILLSMKHAVTWTLVPVRWWPNLPDFPGGWRAALILAGVSALAWVFLCARSWNDEVKVRAEIPLALFGGAWWLFAYAPNFLWYISPRHNYLPSVGTAFVATALVIRLSRYQKTRPALISAGAALFAVCGLYAWSDGSAWAASTALHARFAADTLPAMPAGAGAVYLLGAPKMLRTAPGFFQPREHLYILSRETGTPPGAGDNTAAVNRLGIFSGTHVALFGTSAAPSFTPLSSSTIITLREDGHFERVCHLSLSTPGLAPREIALGAESCPGRLVLEAPVALIESRSARSSAPAPESPTLISASLTTGTGPTFDLTLTWLAGKSPASDFAAYPVLLSAAGQELYRSVYAASAREHEILWPLFNDAQPPSSWHAGQMIIERYRLRRNTSWNEPPIRLRLTPFKRRGTQIWETLPTQEILLKTT